jgi:S1-C subfamily serine protease
MEPSGQVLTVGDPDEKTLGDRLRPVWERSWLPGARERTGADPRPRRRRVTVVRIAALVVGVLVAAGWLLRDQGPPPLTRNDVDRAVQAGVEKAQQEARNTPPDAASAYRRILPSLVTVTASGAGSAAATSALGAGVVINAEGSVLTALHVVEEGKVIQVRFADGTLANAKIANRLPENDIAVLGVDRLPEVTVPAVMGGGAQVGDAVFPVGNPLGLRGSLTSGVVSALNRSTRIEGGQTLRRLIQFDAAVNPGNSGGPLLDRDGHVIGIVTALANPSRQPYFIGIGFAVPIATAAGAAGGPSK